MTVPTHPKLYHIAHVDRLLSIVSDQYLWCDQDVQRRSPPGTSIGMTGIKHRRLNVLRLNSHPELHVGDCVPFYFCPRSVMLYLINQANHPELGYRGGQRPIVHLEADLHATVEWANQNGKRWAFTLSNAGANYFEDRCDLDQLHEINWDAVQADKWSGHGISTLIKEGKQAEFLLEQRFPWSLVQRIGVHSAEIEQQVLRIYAQTGPAHRPTVEIHRQWYY